MTENSLPQIAVTIQIDCLIDPSFDLIVTALREAGLADVEPHRRFHIVNGTIAGDRLEILKHIPGVVSVRQDQRYHPLS